MSLYRLARALLFLLPAELAHRLGIRALAVLSRFPGLCEWLAGKKSAAPSLAARFGPLALPHPVCLAAGLDKDAEAAGGFFALGFAAVEVGTLTPKGQPGNPKPRLFRIPAQHAVINRMGFNNHGALEAATRLRKLSFKPGLLGVNLGKNKDTPIEDAAADYEAGVDALGALGDYVVVNASSPNTPGLRQLQEPEKLRELLTRVRTRLDLQSPGKPLFLKISPDLTDDAVDELVDVAIACRVDGLIATNTTLARPFEDPVAKEAGGLSGDPVRQRSTEVIRRAYRRAGGRLGLIGVGGIRSTQDAYEKIRAGASAVQLYTGFIYEGPALVREILAELPALLQRDGFASLSAAVGVDASAPAGERPGGFSAP